MIEGIGKRTIWSWAFVEISVQKSFRLALHLLLCIWPCLRGSVNNRGSTWDYASGFRWVWEQWSGTAHGLDWWRCPAGWVVRGWVRRARWTRCADRSCLENFVLWVRIFGIIEGKIFNVRITNITKTGININSPTFCDKEVFFSLLLSSLCTLHGRLFPSWMYPIAFPVSFRSSKNECIACLERIFCEFSKLIRKVVQLAFVAQDSNNFLVSELKDDWGKSYRSKIKLLWTHPITGIVLGPLHERY